VNAAVLERDPLVPRAPGGRGPALVLALLAHAVLIAMLAFGVHWRSGQPAAVSAELWSAVPQAAAPRAAEPGATPPPRAAVREAVPPTRPPTPTPPAPTPNPAPVPTPKAAALPDPQIAIEQARREATRRAELEQQREARAERAQQAKQEAQRERTERERARQAAQDKSAAAAAKTERERASREQADAQRLTATREANLKRIQGLAGASGGPADTGSALHSSGPSASYPGRIMARIKPNILFTDLVDGNPMATVEVRLSPDGAIVARRLVKPSGVRAWDDAVLRAIDRTEVLPRDVDGRVPASFQIDFRLRD
jgi:colicin import membrane protein